MKRYRMLIDGRWVDSSSGETVASINPATEETIAEFPAATLEDVDGAVRAARGAFARWSATPVVERAEILRKVASGIRAKARELAMLETLDMGKPIYDATTFDIPDAANTFDYFATAAAEIGGETIPVAEHIRDYTTRSPVGVVAQITAWNFPLVNAAWKLAPALAMGNTVVFKPSELASLSTLELGAVFQEVGIPPGVVNIITGYGATAGATLAAHPGIDKISFTGSTATGRSILGAGAPHLLPVTLELGGKSANIVFEDANLDQAVAGALFGIFFNAGQVCTAGSRLLLHKTIYDEFLDRFLTRACKICIGPGTDPATRLGPLVSKNQQERVLGYIQSGIEQKARVLFRGEIPQEVGYFIPPTVFDRVSREMKIAREEIFGPVLCVFAFESEEEAIAIANDTDYGLAAGVWTRDINRAHRVSRQLDAGTVWVNTYNFVMPQMPVPARKSSGMGVELGRQGLEEYTLLKNIVENLGQEPFDYFGSVLSTGG